MSLRHPEACADLWGYVYAVRPEIERALTDYLPIAPTSTDTNFNDALRYALFPGGKRLRPILTLIGAELVGGRSRDVMAAAAAVEYVHTSSLIFDDLPCMDDATERRGLEALHLRYGESLAVLVALALLNASYGLVFMNNRDQQQCIDAHRELVACVGTNGMVMGQTVDLSDTTGRDEFDAIRNLKTSALMRLSLRLGAILSGADAGQLAALSQFAELIGQAYQLSDDMIDLNEDALLCVGGARTATLAYERGMPDAKLRVACMVAEAKSVLTAEFGTTRPALLLGEMADYIATRES
ncbi:MAG: polyprenyl synthetase family protein [Pyrinomonadaceae bacterium]